MLVETNIPQSCNYIEFVIKGNHSNEENHINVSLTEQEFLSFLEKVKMPKYFKKHSKCYQFNNIVFENSFNQEMKVYAKDIVKVDATDSNIVCSYCKKEKQPFHTFPSTSKLNTCYYSKKIIFRFHNRVYLNFETIGYLPETNNVYYKIYINYNHDENVDLKSISQCIESVLSMLGIKPQLHLSVSTS